MKPKLYLHIAFRIVLLGVIGSLITFVTPQLRPFFGDTLKTEPSHSGIDEMYDWGIRHYWYFWVMIALFILSLISTIISIRNSVLKHYPQVKNW